MRLDPIFLKAGGVLLAFALATTFPLFGVETESVGTDDELQRISEAIRKNPEDARLYKRRAEILFESGFVGSTYDDLKIALKGLPKDGRVNEMLFLLGEPCFTENHYGVRFFRLCSEISPDRALKHVELAVKEFPDKAGLRMSQANLLFLLNRSSESLVAVEKAIELDGDASYFWQLKIRVLRALELFPERLESLVSAVDKFPETVWFYERLYQTHQFRRDYESMLKTADRHLKEGRYPSLALYYKAVALIRSGREKEGTEVLRKLQAENPEFVEGTVLLAKVLFIGGQQEEAFPFLDYLVKRGDVDDLELYNFLARYHLEREAVFQAERVVLSGLAFNSPRSPNFPGARHLLFKLALIYERQRKPLNAERVYRLLLRDDPENPAINGNLGRLFYNEGEYAQAEPYLENAIQSENSRSFVPVLADTYQRLGRYEEALRLLEAYEAGGEEDVRTDYVRVLVFNRTGELMKALGAVNRLRTGAPTSRRYLDLEIATLSRMGFHEEAQSELESWLERNESSFASELKLALLKHKNGENAEKRVASLINDYQPSLLPYELSLSVAGLSDRHWNFDERSAPLKRIRERIFRLEFDSAEKALGDLESDFNDDVRFHALRNLNVSLRGFLLGELDTSKYPPRLGKAVMEKHLDATQSSQNSAFRSWMTTWAENSGVYLSEDENATSIRLLERAVEIDPQNDLAYALLGNAYRRTERYERAAEAYRVYIGRRPENDEVKISLAICYDFMKRYGAAEEIYLDIKEKDPNNSVVLNNLAWMYLTAEDENFKDAKKALSFSKLSTDIAPTAYGLDTLAEAFFQNNQIGLAVKTIERALLYDSRDLDHFKIQKRKFEKALKNLKPD